MGRPQVVFNLGTARRMVPLLRRIVGDILLGQRSLEQLGLEQEALDQQKRTLDWPQRHRRYHVHEDYILAQRNLQDALAELEVLNVRLIDPLDGQVGLPTVVNGQLAFFSWKPTESTVQFWHFAAEKLRRTIPASWNETAAFPSKENG
jgi:hypothetical protein